MSEEALDYIRSSMSYSFQASSLQESDFLESNSVFDQFDPITGEEVKNNRISLDRSDSLVIHDVPETIPIDKKKGKIDSSHLPVEQSSSNAVHSLLQSIRDETEKYLVTQEGTLILGSEMLYSFRFITITHFAI